jgi:hypothetical protein
MTDWRKSIVSTAQRMENSYSTGDKYVSPMKFTKTQSEASDVSPFTTGRGVHGGSDGLIKMHKLASHDNSHLR